MHNIKEIYRLVNILSLDVSAGAVIGSFFLADFFGTAPSTNGVACLALSVWLIYTSDHLLDAYRMGSIPVTPRHAFHRRHFSVLTCIVGVVALIDFSLVLTLPFSMIRNGMVLGVFIVLYLLFVNRFAAIKEPIAAALYCFGILIPMGAKSALSHMDILLTGQFFLVALMNLLLFSWFDFPKDRAQGTRSGVLVIGRSSAAKIIWLLFALNTFILVAAVPGLHFLLLWCIGFGNMVLFILHRKVGGHDNFRLIGDALFLLPVLSLL